MGTATTFPTPLDAEVGKVKTDLGIVEETDTATHNISAGQYVIWHGELTTAASAISVGDTLSSSNLTAVSGGGFNALNAKFATLEDSLTTSGSITDKTIQFPTGFDASNTTIVSFGIATSASEYRYGFNEMGNTSLRYFAKVASGGIVVSSNYNGTLYFKVAIMKS